MEMNDGDLGAIITLVLILVAWSLAVGIFWVAVNGF
jgi:hypothetical protein